MNTTRSGTLLIGYDVEGIVEDIRQGWGKAYSDAEAVTQIFLTRATEAHHKYQAPCTLFALGRILEQNLEYFQELAGDELFDIQQHTYSHVRLKTVVEEGNNEVRVYEGGTLEKIAEDVGKASSLFRKYLDRDCIGLSGPFGYYRGLSDRLDILQIIHSAGIRFVRTYARNEHGSNPVSLDVQPFWYRPQGFPDLLEIPAQDWQDCIYRELHGWENTEKYISHLCSNLDYIAAQNLVWCICLHDFTSIRDDPKMSIVCRLIEYARKKHIRIMSCKEYYEENRRLLHSQ